MRKDCIFTSNLGNFSLTYPEWVIIGTVERLTKFGEFHSVSVKFERMDVQPCKITIFVN